MNANEQQLLQALSISANNDSVDLEDCKVSFAHKLNDQYTNTICSLP